MSATSTWAIGMVRDEADVLPATLSRLLDQVDHVLVLDNGSVDDTRGILDALDRVTVLDDPDPAYYQSRKITRLACHAADFGADWIVPFDADEVWLPREHRRVADELAALPSEILIAQAVMFDHVATAADPVTCDPLARLGWRRAQPTPFRKVACRVSPDLVIHQGNHSAGYAGVRHPATAVDVLEIRHFPIRSPEQWVRKARNGAQAYAATDLPTSMGQHWRDWGTFIDRHGEQALAEAFYEHHFSADPDHDDTLVFDPCR